MKNSLKLLLLGSVLSFSSIGQAFAAEVELDRVAVIVNTSVVLESEIKDLITSVTLQAKKNNKALPSDRALRVQVMEKLINDSIVLQLGDRMGVQISDAQLDETLSNMAKDNNQSLDAFRQSLVSDGLDYEKYRENVRNELVSGEVRRASLRRRIYVSPQEIGNLLSVMKEQTNADVEYRLGHILIEFPTNPKQSDINEAKIRADKVLELLNNGSDFTNIAMTSSSGANALEGGDLGWKSINEMPTLFSELVDGQKKGSVFGPIRTGLGFSIVKLVDVRGRQTMEVEEVKASHILIKPSIILSEAKAKALLQGFVDKLNAGEADFAELAKEYSEGPTSVRGGDLGWSDPSKYDPAFSEALASLDIDEVHKPFRSSFGWHIAKLTGRRIQDATEQMNESRAYQLLYNRQFGMEGARWIKELRDEAYIEILEVEQE
ncbi:peptidylprolyl isomerase SurA [Colwellia sp. Arc7-635]|uniref:peptidylprolyl isomerase SurA n=1 Tax=Colwellia sp. Arc7-635 TaxID=2497879 RepID=UPI000F8576A8|nr:peptidylprolyl isomerase SurA [Colwellia sp. Arc7-635]AZQ83258.1 peptidylprolyl isomerase SurA [Colwellia sp. Arc7-635]